MIKLADLLELSVQPGEGVKMKNYLKRGSAAQMALHPNPNPEEFPGNTNKVVGWSWEEDNTLEEKEMADILSQTVRARELQSLEDVRKLIKRLESRGYAKTKILSYIKGYLTAK